MHIDRSKLPSFVLPALMLAVASVVRRGGERHPTVEFIVHRGIPLGDSDEPKITTDIQFEADFHARIFFPGSRCGIREKHFILSAEPGLEKLLGRPVSFIYPTTTQYGYMVVWDVDPDEYRNKLSEMVDTQRENEGAIMSFMDNFARQMEENVSVCVS